MRGGWGSSNLEKNDMTQTTTTLERGAMRAAAGEADSVQLAALISLACTAFPEDGPQRSAALLDADENGSNSLHAAVHAVLLVPTRSTAGGAKPSLELQEGSSSALSCVRLLLDAGADPAERDVHGLSALYLAARDAQVGAIELLSTHPRTDPNAAARNGLTPLAYATSHGQARATAALLRLFAGRIDVDAVNSAGETALLMACRCSPECTRLMLDVGHADPRIASLRGETPLMIAAGFGQTEAVELLLAHEAGAECIVLAKDKRGKDAAQYAAMSGSQRCSDLIQNHHHHHHFFSC